MNKLNPAALPDPDPAHPLFDDDRAYVAKIVSEHSSDSHSDIGLLFFELMQKISGIVEMRTALAGETFNSRKYHRDLVLYGVELDEVLDGSRPAAYEPNDLGRRTPSLPRRFNA